MSTLMVETIPTALKELGQWVCWRYETRHGKQTKVPYMPNGRKANSTDPKTWSTFEQCVEAAPRFNGIGIVCAHDLAGVDMDHCIDDAGILSDQARRVVDILKTYTEITPSGHGIRCLCFGKLPEKSRRNAQLQIEMYDSGRYFTVTGHTLPETRSTVERRDDELAQVHAEIFGHPNSTETKPLQPEHIALDDLQLIEHAKRAKNGSEVTRLWQGDLSLHNDNHSDADLALCSHLAFWTGLDAGRMDRLFRQSGLMRPKWDERHRANGTTYGQMTIEKALSGVHEFFRLRHNGHGNGNGHPSPARDDEADITLQAQGGQYVIHDGRMCRWKSNRDGMLLVPLCNFTAQITEEISRDDGQEVMRFLTIEGRRANGMSLPPARVDAAQFSSMRWVTLNWGTSAIVEAGQSSQDHLRAAIQYQSHDIAGRHVFTHTGWRTIDGKMVFLSQDGAVGGTPVVVELDDGLERFSLPTQPQDVRRAMMASLRFLDIAPKSITVPLWSAMYLAPVSSIIPPHFTLWLYGSTGALKSSTAAVAVSHFGNFTENDLIGWIGTTNSLEKILFLAKDVPIIIDDFAPQADQNSARKIEETAGHMVRGVGNHTARTRLRSDLTLRQLYRPRGLVISTGEQLPDGQSLGARLFIVEMRKGEVDLDKISAAQAERHQYPHAMAGYIQWLGNQWIHLEQTLPPAWLKLRGQARTPDEHLRLPDALASLYTGLDLGLAFAVEIGALSESEAHARRAEGWEALTQVAQRQHSLVQEERPTQRFLTILGELVAQGKVRFSLLDESSEQGNGELIGWYDAAYLYLLPGASYRQVAQFARESNRYFGVKEYALRKALAEEGFLMTPDGRYADQIRVGADRRQVLRLWREKAENYMGAIHKNC